MKNIILYVLIICLPELAHSQTVQQIAINTENWLLSEECQIVEFQGRQSILIERSADDSLQGYHALVKKFNFKDGIIEYDMFCPQQDTTDAGFLFRLTNYNEEDRYELFFFRPYQTNETGAVQYMPVNNEEINWPDYDHDVYKSDGAVPWNEWVHVKAEIEGPRATIYVNDTKYMTIDNLARGRTVGKVGFWMGNTPQCYFSDFEMTVDSIVSDMTGDGKKVHASSVSCDPVLAGYVFDGNMSTRWGSEYSDPQWIMIDLGEVQKVGGVILRWEAAYATSYEIRVSQDSADWTTVFSTTTGKGGTDKITFDQVDAQYVMMYGISRGTIYGYSIWEFEVYDSLELPSSVKDIAAIEDLVTIYPNPVSDIINIETSYSVEKIEIFNISGNKISEYIVNQAGCNIQLDVSDLYKGIYYIRIQTSSKVITRKQIIL